MISVEGAALIAQVYPVGILLLLLETGRIVSNISVSGGVNRAYTLVSLLTSFVAVIAASSASAISLGAALNNKALEGGGAWFVVASGWALYIGVAVLAGQVFGLNFREWIDKARAAKLDEMAAMPQAAPSASIAAAQE
jgi:hypothetical protein